MTRRLKCRIDPEQSPYTCVLPEHKPVRRARDDRPARGRGAAASDGELRAVSYEAVIDQLFKRMRSSSSALTQTSDQYSQGPGTQRKTSPATATWQTDGNDR